MRFPSLSINDNSVHLAYFIQTLFLLILLIHQVMRFFGLVPRKEMFNAV